jgi:prepilin-type N-terminal cleavage/methylation domain-containing protein/prepilin-type processing-associated H-X9-DG protein
MMRRRGFSLIELLVVIGIIATLVALLLPALNRAREQAKMVACMSNMRQLIMATGMYNDEFHEQYPAPAWIGDHEPDDWIYWEQGLNPAQGVLMPYLGGYVPAVLRCPSDDLDSHITTSGLNGQADVYRYSYSFNEMIFNHANRVNRRPTFVRPQIHNPSEKIMVIDESSQTIDDGCWWAVSPSSNDRNVLANRHYLFTEDAKDYADGSGNAGFCDGHVERVSRSDATSPTYYDPTID